MAGKRGRNEGSIFKRDDGRWCSIVDLGFEDCKRKRKYYYGRTEKEVRDQLLKARSDHSRGLPVAFERQTVGQFLYRWLEDSVKLSVRPLTYQQYEQHIRLYLAPKQEIGGTIQFLGLPALGRIELSKLTPQHVQSFVNYQLKRRIESQKRLADTQAEGVGDVDQKSDVGQKIDVDVKTLSPRTVQLSLVILRHALDQAVKWGLVARNVAKLVDSPKAKRAEIRTLTPEQAGEFLKAAKGVRLEALYSVTLAVGLRQGEALALRWCDIDLESRTISVRQTLERIGGKRYGKPGKLEFVEPKTDRSRRTIAIPESLVKALKSHRGRQAEERLVSGSDWQDFGLVFCTSRGTPIEPSSSLQDFKRLLVKAGLPRSIRFHDLRHSAASLLLAQGVPLRAIMELLGHSTIGVTANTYAHVLPSVMREMADKMDAVLISGQ